MVKDKIKKRLDILLVEKELFESRQKAQAAIMAGIVYVDHKKEDKPGSQFLSTVFIEVKGNTCPYVSRGGLKLDKALKEFDIDVNDKICIDAGASSGGFTDCLLQHGARLVYAVDVGYGQLDWKLRNDNRVKVFEKTNIRYLTPQQLYDDTKDPVASLCSVDLSFISVTKVLGNILNLLGDEKQLIILIKPQFEAGKGLVPKSGVVKDKSIHIDVINNILNFCSTLNLYLLKLTFSPIKGPSGNIEYLCHVTNFSTEESITRDHISQIVDTAHQELN